jgi:hypothetical protein
MVNRVCVCLRVLVRARVRVWYFGTRVLYHRPLEFDITRSFSGGPDLISCILCFAIQLINRFNFKLMETYYYVKLDAKT